jgi:hypothetical protein
MNIESPFSLIECPICGSKIDLSIDKDSLYLHIKISHKNEPLAPIAESIYKSLNQSVPENLYTVSFNDLARALSNACRDAANKQGLKKLRKQVRKK